MSEHRKARRSPGGITVPRGFYAAGATAGIKASGKPDIVLIVADRPCAAAGVFTKNQLPGAPVVICQRRLRRATARAILCNSGCANDATGDQGLANALQTCRWVAQYVSAARLVPPLRAQDVLPASTGVIGPQLPMPKMDRGIATLASRLARGPAPDAHAACGIMTTDLVPKTALRRLRLNGKTVALAAIAKGSGMIAPNMATMLVFVTTDAAIAPAPLRAALKAAVAESFNRISVDAHTSPSDMVLVLASGAAANRPVTSAASPDFQRFRDVLADLCRDLAYQVVQDGEGATKVFRVRVLGAPSELAADEIARCVVNSPLVKTAVHGADPNWGRIVTAAANARARFNPGKMTLRLGDGPGAVAVFQRGQPVGLDLPTQRRLLRIMRAPEVIFTLDLSSGRQAVEWLGCDLSRQYIAINAEYTS